MGLLATQWDVLFAGLVVYGLTQLDKLMENAFPATSAPSENIFGVLHTSRFLVPTICYILTLWTTLLIWETTKRYVDARVSTGFRLRTTCVCC
jgi:hypothetical protein